MSDHVPAPQSVSREDSNRQYVSPTANSLLEAVESGEYARVKETLRSGPNLEVRNAAGYTPLLVAASRRDTDIVQLLNDSGALLDATGNDGNGVWDIALKNLDGRLLHVLHERGAKIPASLKDSVTRLLKELPKAERTGTHVERGGTRGTADGKTSRTATGQQRTGTKSGGHSVTTINTVSELAEYTELLKLASPHLYRRNLFRLLKLGVTAVPADVRRQQKRLEMQRKLGVVSAEETGGALALVPSPTDEDMQLAMDRLNDPKARLLDELFWFWPVDKNTTDQGIQAIEQGNVDAAREFWTKESGSPERRQIAAHNLAILDHLLALDIEAQNVTDSRLPELWNRAYVGWQEALDGDELGSRVRERIRQLNDVGLTTGFARRLQATLPKAILSINARMALAAAESGNTEQAKRHTSLVQTWKKSGNLPYEVLGETLNPIRDRLKALCDTAEQKTEKDVEHANATVWEFLTDCKPLLKIVDLIVPEGDPVRQTLHDRVASTALDCKIAYGNKVENWVESIKLGEAALAIAIGSAVRQKIESNLETVRELDADSRCFFCNRNTGLSDSAVTVQMHGNVYKVDTGDRTYSLRWKHADVKVPRCPTCKQIQRWMPIWKLLGVIAGSVMALGVNGLASRWTEFSDNSNMRLYFTVVWMIMMLAGFVVANYLIRRKVGYRVRPEWQKTQSPLIKDRQKQGWTFGQEPTDSEKTAAQYTHAEWTYKNGSYKGEIRNGKKHGKGVTVFDNGDRYEGEYKDGQESGGWYCYKSGVKEWCLRNAKGEWIDASPPPGATLPK